MIIKIEIENVSFSYGCRSVLEGCNLAIPNGEIWALIGRSGTGKTTLLQIIAGLFRPQSGAVRIKGKVNSALGMIKGVVFQEDCLLGWLTVVENLLFPNHRKPDGKALQKAQDLIIAVGLDKWENSLPKILSFGMRKRVEFARALLSDPEYLLADEPFGTVDALTRHDLWRMWQSLRSKEPRTGILCTHDAEEALRLCDVVVPLLPGPPAVLGEIIRVPKRLKTLEPDSIDKELLDMKKIIIKSLDRISSF